MGDWVLRTVLRQISDWHRETGNVCPVAIKVSTRQLGCKMFRQQLIRHLKQEQLPPEVIEIELTETTVMHNPDAVLEELTALHDMGVRISIDDFDGTGCSLDYLRRLPIDYVKIDKSFTQGIGVSHPDQNIIKVIVAIAKAMKMEVIAEGIETETQAQFLQELGCDYGQGYLYSYPLKHANMASKLRGYEKVTDLAKVRSIAAG
ncbi:MAG: EAL domain-containing protein [Gammaproteobacteria bacterium]|nr:EAL domain-containing protein [Gammaproteobacteria bacterium]